MSYDRAHEQKGFVFEPPSSKYLGESGGGGVHDEMPTNLAMAYDAIYASGELERLSDDDWGRCEKAD